jgi:hypothetical protein
MKTRTFQIEDKRSDRLDNLLLQRGQTLEEFLEPWLADADTHMGHNPADDPEDQEAMATIFQKKAIKAAGERQEAARVKAEQEAAVAAEPKNEGKDGKQK